MVPKVLKHLIEQFHIYHTYKSHLCKTCGCVEKLVSSLSNSYLTPIGIIMFEIYRTNLTCIKQRKELSVTYVRSDRP